MQGSNGNLLLTEAGKMYVTKKKLITKTWIA